MATKRVQALTTGETEDLTIDGKTLTFKRDVKELALRNVFSKLLQKDFYGAGEALFNAQCTSTEKKVLSEDPYFIGQIANPLLDLFINLYQAELYSSVDTEEYKALSQVYHNLIAVSVNEKFSYFKALDRVNYSRVFNLYLSGNNIEALELWFKSTFVGGYDFAVRDSAYFSLGFAIETILATKQSDLKKK